MKTVFSNCNIIDTENGCAVRHGADITVSDGKIESITDHSAAHPGCRVYDMSGKYALPGLINLHVHLFGSGRPSKVLGGGSAQRRLIAFIHTKLGRFVLSRLVNSAAENQLNSGVTTVRAVGDFCGSDIDLRNALAKGKGGAAGLRVLVSGPAITVPGGHGDGTFANVADTEEGLVRLVDENVGRGADLIKICITGGVMDAKKKGEPGEVRMNEAQVKAVCDRAHSLGKKVAAHVQSGTGAEIAARGGVDTIEHGSVLSEECIELMKSRGGAVVVTYSPALPNVYLPSSVTKMNELCAYNSKVVMDSMTIGAKQAMAAGLHVGLGTDASCPFCTQTGTWREVVCFSKIVGVPASDALIRATLGNAEILGLQNVTGSVSVGKSADIAFYAADPVEDLNVLRRPCAVSAGRRFIKKPRPKLNRKTEAILDTVMEEIMK